LYALRGKAFLPRQRRMVNRMPSLKRSKEIFYLPMSEGFVVKRVKGVVRERSGDQEGIGNYEKHEFVKSQTYICFYRCESHQPFQVSQMLTQSQPVGHQKSHSDFCAFFCLSIPSCRLQLLAKSFLSHHLKESCPWLKRSYFHNS